MTLRISGAAACALVLAAGGAHANRLVNGGFETGDFSGWTQGGNTGYTFVTCCGYDGFNGQGGSTYFAALGPIKTHGTLSQTFSDRAGARYKVSFWLGSDGSTPSDFSARVGGFSDSLTDVPWTNGHYSHVVGYFIGSGSDTLSFAFRDDNGYLMLDSVSVGGAIPEPASWALMTLGFGALGGALRHRCKAASSAA